MKTVAAEKLSIRAMVAGNENKFSKVIDDGVLKEWVGIGWIDCGRATKAQRQQFPKVVRK